MNKCPFCDFTYEEASELEDHLLKDHFLTMQSYYELKIIEDLSEEDRSYRKDKYPLTYISNSSCYLPGWGAITNCLEKKQITGIIQSSILDYYGKVSRDRFLQLFLSTDKYFNNTLNHTYDDFKRILNKLQKQDRNKLWYLDWYPGYPKIICEENLDGIKIVKVDNSYKVENSKTSITINNWKIIFPEIIPFDQRHHSRYNLLNTSIDVRNTKRLRMKNKEDQCIKFYNRDNFFKSLFKIVDLDGNDLPFKLSKQDLLVTKLVLLRNKSFIKLILCMMTELIKNVNTLRDSVFLRNTVVINPEVKKGTNINLSWFPENYQENYINISLL